MSTDFRPSVVILGSTSGITRATAQAFAEAGYILVLAARDDEENAILAADIAVRHGVPCHALHFDAEDLSSHGKFVEACEAAIGTKPTGVVLGYGYMAEQEKAQKHMAEVEKMTPRNSQSNPGNEIPEEHWAYRFAKKHWFFGFGAYT